MQRASLVLRAPVERESGPGRNIVETRCNACHSLDHGRMNSPFLTSDGWRAGVAKMRSIFGAGIDDAEAGAIVKYLTTTCGPPAP
jgi:mono/diheme cytochrome c family protein